LLISDTPTVEWISAFTGSLGFVILTPNDAKLITDSRYTIQAQEQVNEMPTVSFSSPIKVDDFISKQAQDMGIKNLRFHADAENYQRVTALRTALSPIAFEPVENVITNLRMVKSESEIAKIRAACKLADTCFEHVSRLIRQGAVEFDIQLEIEFYFRRNNAELAFSPIVVSGKNSAKPHGHASEKRLEVGDFLTMDFGARLAGQCSDLTRTVVIGEASDRSREIYGKVLSAQEAAINAMTPGIEASELDCIVRTELGDLAQYFGHGLGHGLGSVVHDVGRLTATSKDILAENQVWTIEPGVYIPSFGGVRIEDDVLITATGHEILTHAPKQLTILP